jgi:tetratricopeptide (TPR) repeat protein
MADIGLHPSFRYSAFISYSHYDSTFVRRLHRRLETYRLPRRLRGASARVNANGRLKPVFRDREELGAAGDLNASVRAALADAGHLIVVCSARTEASAWVRREIALFRQLHGDGAVFAVLIEGATEDAFQALFRGADGDGTEPLAADFRRTGDGGRLAFLKLVAGLADVRLDALVQRDAQRRVRRVSMISFASLAAMAAMGVLALVAVRARNDALREEARGETLIDYMLTDMRGRLKSVGRLDLLDALNKGATAYYASQDLARLPASALEQRAKLLQAIGEDDESRGQLTEAAAQFEEAARTTKALLDEAPDDQARIFAHSQSEFWVGQVALLLGNYNNVEAHFQVYFELANKLVEKAPRDPDMLMERGYAQSNLGIFFLRRQKYSGAEKFFIDALLDFIKVGEIRRDDSNTWQQVATGYAWLGTVKRLQGSCAASLTALGKERKILENLKERDGRNTEIRYSLIANELASARATMCEKNWQAAIAILEQGKGEAAALAETDSNRADFRQQARVFELFEVEALMQSADGLWLKDSKVREMIGDCRAEEMRPRNRELATFCYLSLARYAAFKRDVQSAKSALLSAQQLEHDRTDGLSPNWGIDFFAEKSDILALINK